MSLKELFETMSPAERDMQLGIDTANPLTKAFTSKRVVHAGLGGAPVSGDEAQAVWKDLMQQPAPKGVMQSAYIHIPFCQTKCLYCGFFQHASKQEIEDKYVDELVKEIRETAANPRVKDGLIQSVFIGGGTPTSLSANNAARLLQTIHDCLPLSNDYELTLEGRVHDLVPEKMDAWMANGVNRVSLGVQSFNTKVRQQVGRIDDQETILRRLEELKAYNQASIIVDLIYGLPDQTMDVWMEDLAILDASAADGMDLYQLNVYQDSDLHSYIESGKLSKAATTAEQAEMYKRALEYIAQRDYKRLSACHWSRSIRERSMYNTMAKRGYPMFPFGCGAGGNVGGYAMMMHRALAPYNRMREEGKKPLMALMKQSPLQAISDCIIDQLERCRFDVRPLVAMDPRLEELTWLFDQWVERGLATYNGYSYELTVAGDFWHINLTQSTLECAQYLMTGERRIFKEAIAAQDNNGGMPKGHPPVKGESSGKPAMPAGVGMPKGHPADVPLTGGHPAGIPKGHPADIPMTGGHPAGIPKGHPADIPMTGGHPAGITKGHPAHIPMTGGHPAGIPKGHSAHIPMTGGHPAGIPKGSPRHAPVISAMGLKRDTAAKVEKGRIEDMKYIVVYSSLTGNTKMVAEAIANALPAGTPCVSAKEVPADLSSYDCVFAGFWADRGTADAGAQSVIKTLDNKHVALFATLGVPPQMPHAAQTMEAAKGLLPNQDALVSTFHCQGKIDPKVIEMMYKMFPKGSAHGQSEERDALHASATTHPDQNDLANAATFAKQVQVAIEG